MRITITSTDDAYLLNDTIPCRAWDGVTDKGTRCRVYVVMVEVPDDVDSTEFDDALKPITVVEPLDPRLN